MSRPLPRLAVLSLLVAAPLLAQDRPAIGSNLDRPNDWNTEFAFVDAFKSSRQWISGRAWSPSEPGAWSDGRALDLDERGWVRSLQSRQIARTLLFWGNGLRYPSGRYVVRYEGEGTIQYTPNVRRVESSPGREVLEVDSTWGSGIGFYITAVDPANHLRNIRVYMPGFEDGDRRFHPDFLAGLRGYRAIRFLNWMAHEQLAPHGRWSERPRLDDARWSGRGVPVEVMVDLVNELGVDPWFTMPHLADDEYVRNFAAHVRDHLRSDLVAYVEHSNEVWNGVYPQARYAQEQGLALGLSTTPFEAQMRFHSRRTRQITSAFAEVMGQGRVVRVLGMMAVNSWWSDRLLAWEDTRAHVDALAIAPYFGIPYEDQERVRGMTAPELLDELRDRAVPFAADMMYRQAAVARRHGVDLVAYEGGQHLVGIGPYQGDATLNALYDAANRHPRMGLLYWRYLQDWAAAGGGLFVHFTSCGGYGRYGRFGALEYLAQPRAESPKYDALMGFIEGAPAPEGDTPPFVDDLAGLSDEFGDPASIARWQRVVHVEGWNADQLQQYDVSGSVPGWMTMTPYTSSWFRDYRGDLSFQEVEGDFVITTRVRTTGRSGAGAPRSAYSLGGILVRAPRQVTPATWQPGGENFLFLSHGTATNLGTYEFEVKTTVNSASNLATFRAGSGEALLQIARVGRTFLLLVQVPGGSWTVLRRFDRPDLPAHLQVGLTAYTDWYGCSRYTPFDHNSRVIATGSPDLVARFDFARFHRPEIPAHLRGRNLGDAVAVPDADLLSFLGEAPSRP